MKKTIILALMLITLCGCEKKEQECPEPKEKVYIKYSGTELNADKVLELYNKDSFYNLMENLKFEFLQKEFKDDKETLDKATKFAEDTITQLETYYGEELLNAIQQNTNYKTVEEYKTYVYNSQLESKYLNNYILENNNMEITKEEDIDNSIIYRYYYEALEKLFEKNKLSFPDKALETLYKEYMEDTKEQYLEYAKQATEE